MKTRIIATAAILLFSISLASASPKTRTLSFRDALGRTFTMPTIIEEAQETAPFDIQAEFSRIRSSETAKMIDLSGMLKPEQEEALPFDLDEVLKTLK